MELLKTILKRIGIKITGRGFMYWVGLTIVYLTGKDMTAAQYVAATLGLYGLNKLNFMSAFLEKLILKLKGKIK